MSFWKNLFGSSSSEKLPGEAADAEWQRFFHLASIHESIQSDYRSFVGRWPPEISPSVLSGVALEELVKTLQSHITGCHPGRSSKPDYRIMNGKIARASNPFIDAIICQALPRGELPRDMSGFDSLPPVFWKLIERHSGSPIAKFLFALPHVYLASEAGKGKPALLVVNNEDLAIYKNLSMDQILRIQVYKGVENAIFGAYEDLPEGGYLTAEVIQKKVRSLLA